MLQMTEEREVRGGTRVACGVLGILAAGSVPLAVVQGDWSVLPALAAVTIIFLVAGFRGRSIVDRLVPDPRRIRRPDVDPALVDGAPEPVRALVRGGRLLDAIRTYRQATGASLTAAKAVIDGIAWRERERRLEQAQLSPEVRDLALRDRTLDAIRLYREQTGASLAPAAELIQTLQAQAHASPVRDG